jgi:N-acyl-D-aspartate/D-glutamate deacylase
MGWETSVHPFILATGYNEYRFMDPDRRIAELKKPEVRDKILNSENVELDPFAMFIVTSLHKVYPMATTTDYEPSPDNNAVAIAKREGRTTKEVIYDAMMEEDGRGILYFPLFGYAYSDFSAIEETMKHPQTGISLADGGAHLGAICDGSTPTFMLTHWTRDRTRGPKMPLEFIVKQQTSETAQQYGLFDRGVIAPGMKADINIIDYDNLTLPAPRMIHDLPAGGRRLYQGASGYIATVMSGVVTYENDVATGELPGKLIRGRQERPELSVAAE